MARSPIECIHLHGDRPKRHTVHILYAVCTTDSLTVSVAGSNNNNKNSNTNNNTNNSSSSSSSVSFC